MSAFSIRALRSDDRGEVAELICVSTNSWYQSHGQPPIFPGGAASSVVFFDVYEALDQGCGIVAEDSVSGRLAGSCFFHPRPTHVSLGIMNVHPDAFGQGVAKRMLDHVVHVSDQLNLPLRLVSSAMNLDSFSLYSRSGFVPQTVFQDMCVSVPADGLPVGLVGTRRVRQATLADLPEIVALEMEIAGLSREKDYRYFLGNHDGFWRLSIIRNATGRMDGLLASCGHPGCNMMGPGCARSEEAMLPLLAAELNHHCGRSPVVLVPVQCRFLVDQLYRWGAKNCEIHFGQVRGPIFPLRGVHIPTFLPESA